MIHKPNVSAIIIAKNESYRIVRCIKSLSWTKETIVIDNGSLDDTLQLAKNNGAKVFKAQSSDFSSIRNLGATHAFGDWLLYVDADELVNEALQHEILETISRPGAHAAYFIPRQNYYLGELWPTHDGMVRLIRKDNLMRWEGVLHEHAVVNGTIGSLKHYFIHDTHRTLSEMVAKTNEWSALEAQLRFEHHHPLISWWRLLRVMITAFIQSYVVSGGWRAGAVGWIESIYQSFSIFITYAKLWELQQKNTSI